MVDGGGMIRGMRHLIAAVALFGGLTCAAQVNGTPPSVTSLRPGQGFSNAPRPSVTSMGPFGWTPPPYGFLDYKGYTNGYYGSGYNGFSGRRGGRSRFNNAQTYVIPFFTPYPAYPLVDPGPGEGPENAGYAPSDQVTGPAQNVDSPAPPAAPTSTAVADPPPAPKTALPEEVSQQESTVLVFRDGHRLQVRNYAIVGNQVYNFSDSGPRKIAVSDLDVAATSQVNDDRGIIFRLPTAE